MVGFLCGLTLFCFKTVLQERIRDRVAKFAVDFVSFEALARLIVTAQLPKLGDI